MSNIGKKVRIINDYCGHGGEIGTITGENYTCQAKYFYVLLEDGTKLMPNVPNNPVVEQCEFVEDEIKYTIQYVLDNNIVIHCPTESEAEEICQIFHNKGLRWGNIYSYLFENNWNKYKSDTHYYPKEGEYCFESWYKERHRTIISAKQFIEHNKTEIMETPKTYRINGKKHHLKAIIEDLKEFGYMLGTYSSFDKGFLQTNVCITKQYQELCDYLILTSSSIHSTEREIEFNLPQDYQKALDYLKEAINSPFWNKKTTLILGDQKIEVKITKEDIQADGKTISYLELNRLYNGFFNEYTHLPWKIEVPNIKIGCCTFTKQEIKQILDEYQNLQK